MKRIALIVLTFAALHAVAQTVSTIEQSYGPYQRPSTDLGLALAASKNGILLAWSEIDPATNRARIRTGLLDFNARLISSIETIPTAPTDSAFAPVAASDGTSFQLLYWEAGPPARVMRVAIDAAGHPNAPQQFYFSQSGPNESLRVFPSAPYVAYIDGTAIGFDHDGTSRPAYVPSTDAAADVTIENGAVASAWWVREMTGGEWFCHWACEPLSWHQELHWMIGAKSGTYRPQRGPQEQDNVAVRPVIGTNGIETYIAWVNEGINHYVLDGTTRELATASNADPAQQLAIKCDPKLCLIAFGTIAGDVYALAFDVNRPDYPRTISVATSARREWHPQIFEVGSGRFLITYFSDLTGDAHFAGRIVTTKPPSSRQRAIR